MSIEERASGFVTRADAALANLPNATQIWTESIRSNTDERRLHSLSVELDNAIRKVDGTFDTWAGLMPEQVEVVAESAPIELLWLLSAHPSGRIREAFVHNAKDLPSDRILPHMANRSIDFVPEISGPASQLVLERLGETLADRLGDGDHGLLSTDAHIAVDKLLTPRTAIVSPELIGTCIEVAKTSVTHRPGSLTAGHLDKMLQRCRQTQSSTSNPASIAAIEALTAYFNANANLS